jgi:Domain of unknown function (DUF932)
MRANWQEAKVGGGTLIDHSGGKLLARNELVGLHTPEGSATWRPVPHAELVGSLMSGLAQHNIEVKAERYCVSGKDDAKIFGVLDLVIPHLATPEYGMALGFRGSNDKSLAIQATAGVRVFVCSNLAFSGDAGTVVLRKKHSSRLDLTKVVPPAIDAYLEKANQFCLSIEDMKEYELSESRAKELIYDAFVQNPIMNRRMFPVIDTLYFRNDEQRGMFPDRTLWSLNNSFTQAVKTLPPVVQDRSSRAIGRFFARVVNRDKQGQIARDWNMPGENNDEDIMEGEIIAPEPFID